MRLGFDVDGVLADFNSAYRRLCIEMSGRDLFPPEDDPTYPAVWGYPEYYGYTDEEVAQVWKRIEADPDFWFNLNPLPGMAQVANLYWRGHDLYFISQRVGETAKRQTEQWLIAYSVSVPTVLITGRKGSIVRDLRLDAYIDDRLSNVQNVARMAWDTRVFLLDAPYNRVKPSQRRYTRVSSVADMLAQVNV